MRTRKLVSMSVILSAAVLVGACAKTPVVNLFLAGNKDVRYLDTKSCVPFRLRRVLNHTSRKFGRVTVTSTKREKSENRRKGGAKKSFHLRCQATDFTLKADRRKVLKFLKNHKGVGGYSSYVRHYHIDTGPRRTW
ncbi:MAG: D-Ala-D-Ala carboxypeptidase family metallohydrolase [Hyphomicrobiales bacterium]